MQMQKIILTSAKFILIISSLFIFSCNSVIDTKYIEGKWFFRGYENIDNILSEAELKNQSSANNNFEYTFLNDGNYEYKVYGSIVSSGRYKVIKQENLILEDITTKEIKKFKILFLNHSHMQLNPDFESTKIYIYSKKY